MGGGSSSLQSFLPLSKTRGGGGVGAGIGEEYGGGNGDYHTNNINWNTIKNPMDRYALDYVLGQGGYSVIFHGINLQTKKEIAMKRMKLESGNLNKVQNVFNELDTFQRIDRHHAFIVNLHSTFYQCGCCYFVMDCYPGGDLRLFLRTNNSLKEQSVVYLLACIGSALHHLHCKGVVHRDVKPENIVLDLQGRPYLTDFGISMVSSADNPLPLCQISSGTLAYLAPEVLSPGHCHSYQSDFWSLGVMGYELMFGIRPFPRHCSFESMKFVQNEYAWMWQSLQFNPSSAELVDFNTLHPPIDWIPPYPDPTLCLNEDGTPPDCVIVPIPPCTSIHSFVPSISEDFQKLLNGLMDARIPLRLGSMSHFTEFSEHNGFLLHGCVPFSHLRRMESPLLTDFDFKAHEPLIQISSSVSNYDLHKDDSSFVLDSFSDEIKQRLLNLSYVNTDADGDRRLLLDVSTPLSFQTSRQTPCKSRYDCVETVSVKGSARS